MSKIEVVSHSINLAKHLAKAIDSLLCGNTKKQILLLVSGGSALSVLDYIDTVQLGKNLTISPLDERFSRVKEISNFRQLTNTQFYRQAKIRGVTFVSSLPKVGESIEDASRRWEDALRTWKSTYGHNGVVIAIMGIGLDGHTAGIMPFPENLEMFRNLFEESDRWIIGYDAGGRSQYSKRMTTSISFLKNNVDYAFVYMNGKEKSNITKIIMKSRNIHEYPGTVIHSMKKVMLYTTITIN